MSRGDRFKRRALKRGYKVDEVDEFLERAEATLAGEEIEDPLTPEDVRDVVFRTRWGGYDEWQVDLHLDRLERELDELHTGTAGQRGSNGFPALPPAARDREDRLALPPGQSASTYGNPPVERNEAAAGVPMPPPATVYVAEPADHRPGVSRAPEAEELVRQPQEEVAYAVGPSTTYRSAEPATYGGGAGLNGMPPRQYPAQERAGTGASFAPEPQHEPPAQRSGAGEFADTGSHAEPDGFADSFAALGSVNDYEDPFADHTPKATFRQNFHSASPAIEPPPGPPLPETRPAHSGTTYGAPPAVPEPPVVAPPQPAIDPYAGRHGKVDMTVELPAYGGQLSPFTNEDKMRLADLRSRFKTRRFGSGYDSSQVDRLFDAVAAAMDGQATAKITDADFDNTQFGLVQGGYFEDEVESALTQLRDLFKRRMG